MPDEKITEAHIAETGESAFSVVIEVSGHRLTGDEPRDAGGENLGPSPYDLLTASLGECTAMTIRWYARQKSWPLQRVEVKVTHRKEKRPGQSQPADIFTKAITLHAPLLDDSQRARLLEIAAKCPIQRTLEGVPVIETVSGMIH